MSVVGIVPYIPCEDQQVVHTRIFVKINVLNCYNNNDCILL